MISFLQNTIQVAIAAVVLSLVSPLASAQHTDIWLVLNGNQTAVSPTNLESMSSVLIDNASGKFLFTGDFDDVGQGPNATDDPGFQSEPGTFTAGAILNFRAIGALQFWNGSSWVNSVVDQERIQIEDALSSFTIIDAVGVTNAEGAIDQIAGDGSVHQHVDFSIDNALGGGTVAPGVYLFELELYLTNGVGGPIVHETSESFFLALNFQLPASEFDAAIAQLTDPQSVAVPIPGAALFFLSVLLGVIVRSARTSR